MTHWTQKYVGIPHLDLGRSHEGCDCYGLVRIVYQEELGISLPDYLGYASVDEHAEIAALINGAQHLPMWVPVEGPALAFDLAVFRRGRHPTHLGVVVKRGLMLHMGAHDCAKVERYDAGAWANRLSGLWRHVDVVSEVAR